MRFFLPKIITGITESMKCEKLFPCHGQHVCLFIMQMYSESEYSLCNSVETIYGTPIQWQSGNLAPGTLAPEI